MFDQKKKWQKRANILNESVGNSYDPMSFISKRSVGNLSNLKSNAPDYADDVDVQLAAFDPDQVHAGLEYENGQGIKRDEYRAKAVVLKNLKSNPNYYTDPVKFMQGEEDSDPQLVPPTNKLGSADQPPLRNFTEAKWEAMGGNKPEYPGSYFTRDKDIENTPKDPLSDKLASIDDRDDIEKAKKAARAFLNKQKNVNEIDFVRKPVKDEEDYKNRMKYNPDSPEWVSFFKDYGPKKDDHRQLKKPHTKFGMNEIDFARDEDRPEDKDKNLPVNGGDDTSFKPQITKKVQIDDKDILNPGWDKEEPPTKMQMEINSLMEDSMKKSFPCCKVEGRTNGLITLKTESHQAAFMPVNGSRSQFTLFVRDGRGNEVEFHPTMDRKNLQKVLEKYFGK